MHAVVLTKLITPFLMHEPEYLPCACITAGLLNPFLLAIGSIFFMLGVSQDCSPVRAS